VTDPLTIPARFNGPPGTANGGFTCGLLAGRLDAEVVEVSLRAPPPLERPLTVERAGESAELWDGDALVAEAAPAELALDPPRAVSPEAARAAAQAGHEHWTAKHPFPTCVVCGPGREPGDGMRLFPAPL
jgi:hypothetical protein